MIILYISNINRERDRVTIVYYIVLRALQYSNDRLLYSRIERQSHCLPSVSSTSADISLMPRNIQHAAISIIAYGERERGAHLAVSHKRSPFSQSQPKSREYRRRFPVERIYRRIGSYLSRRQLEKREKQFNYNDVRIQRVRTHATKVTERRLYTKEEGSPKNIVGGKGQGYRKKKEGKKKIKKETPYRRMHTFDKYIWPIYYILVGDYIFPG